MPAQVHLFRRPRLPLEYWWFILFYFICGYAAGFIGALIGPRAYLAISFIVYMGLIAPCICVQVRRLHDTGRSGWWCWPPLLPIVGSIWLLVLMLLPSQPFPNDYDEPDFDNPEAFTA